MDWYKVRVLNKTDYKVKVEKTNHIKLYAENLN